MNSSRSQRTFGRLALAACVLAPLAAAAHVAGISSSAWSREGAGVSARFTFARAEAPAQLAPLLALGGPAAPCTLARQSQQPVANDGMEFTLAWQCHSAGALQVDLSRVLAPLGLMHRHFAQHDGGDELLQSSQPVVHLGAAPSSFGQVVALGVEHILTGPDHLMFLIGLLLGAHGLKGILKLATSFTVGHSITLALAALQIWAPPPRLTESLIAASVIWVGVQNVRRKASDGYWPLALGFGLVHGFGLAGALEAVALGGSGLVMRLFAFNSGVELGQLTVLLPVLPLLAWARESERFERRGVPVLGAGVAAAGAVWLVQRAFGL